MRWARPQRVASTAARLRYGERLISDALLKLPELSQVNLAGGSLKAHK